MEFTVPELSAEGNDDGLSDIDNVFSEEQLENLPEPGLYRMLLRPVRLPTEIKTKGGLILHKATQTIDAESWNNMLAEVVKMGPLCFKHQRYKGMGLEEPPIAEGDIVMVTARVPFQFKLHGIRLIIVSDDQWFARVPNKEAILEGAYDFC